jgi:hypothetical protein
MKAFKADLSFRREDQMTSAGEETAYQLCPLREWSRDSLFISIEVLAIALSRRGLCCETSDPTRRPLAQKLILV